MKKRIIKTLKWLALSIVILVVMQSINWAFIEIFKEGIEYGLGVGFGLFFSIATISFLVGTYFLKEIAKSSYRTQFEAERTRYETQVSNTYLKMINTQLREIQEGVRKNES